MNTRKMLAGLSLIPLAGVLALAGPAGAAAADKAGGPPGNNGTIKIDGVEWDNHPDNEPHVGCTFQVDFYGYDEGELFADMTFTAQPPTGKGETLTTRNINIGEDDNSGGGSEAGHDAEQEITLTAAELENFTPHPKQGYHVKLTVNADGSQGADTKHKVFWVEGCETAEETLIPRNPDLNASVAGNAVEATEAGVDVMGNSITQPAPGNTVQGANTTAVAPTALARTGSPIGISLLLAGFALALGAVARHFSRAKTVTSIS